MGILDSIVGWIAEQVMNILDLITGSVLGALGCDMSVFIRYFPAAETMYEIFVAIAICSKITEQVSASVRRIPVNCSFGQSFSYSWRIIRIRSWH